MGTRKVLYMLTGGRWWYSAFAFACLATDKSRARASIGRGQRTESEERRERSHRTAAKMLAVFDPTVAKCPEGLRSPPVAGAAAAAAGGVGALMKGFSAAHDGAVTVSLGPSGALAYSAANQSPLVPRCCASPRPCSRPCRILLCACDAFGDAEMLGVCVLRPEIR
jgi:hypothetical protein